MLLDSSKTALGEDEELEVTEVEQQPAMAPPGKCPMSQVSAGDRLNVRQRNESGNWYGIYLTALRQAPVTHFCSQA